MTVKATVKCFFAGRLRSPGDEFEIPNRDKRLIPNHIQVVSSGRRSPTSSSKDQKAEE